MPAHAAFLFGVFSHVDAAADGRGADMKVTLVSVGTRGDVQPMVALGKTLQQRGHTVKIAAPPDFAEWITGQGFAFAPSAPT